MPDSAKNGHLNCQAKIGRPTKYRPQYVEQGRKLCFLGATDPELADFFEVSLDSIKEWKNVHPEFSAALKEGKDSRDGQVERSLLRRAMGDEKYPPDTTACIFWLKNRQPAKWRDKREEEHSGTISLVYADEPSVRMSEMFKR